jgi:hypothetical protein
LESGKCAFQAARIEISLAYRRQVIERKIILGKEPDCIVHKKEYQLAANENRHAECIGFLLSDIVPEDVSLDSANMGSPVILTPLREEEAIRLAFQVKPRDSMPKPRAHGTEPKKKG